MRTVKDPDVRKQEILDGAIKIFAMKGYDKTTTADISKELIYFSGIILPLLSNKGTCTLPM